MDIGDRSLEQAKELDERAAEACDADASESDGQSVGRRVAKMRRRKSAA